MLLNIVKQSNFNTAATVEATLGGYVLCRSVSRCPLCRSNGVSMVFHKNELKMIFIESYVKSELRLRFVPLLLVFVVA